MAVLTMSLPIFAGKCLHMLTIVVKSLGPLEQVSRNRLFQTLPTYPKDRKFATMKVNGEVVYMTQILTAKMHYLQKFSTKQNHLNKLVSP